MKNNSLTTVAIIPAYNEENSIAKVILRTRRYVDKVVVCDDGSNDMTSMIAEELGAGVVRHNVNRGKGEALRTLYKEIMKLNPDIIVAVDGDGQHDPDQIPMLLKPIETGESDVVVGSRYIDGGGMDAPLHRRFGLRVINFLYKKAAGLNIKDTQCGFRAYSKKAFDFLMQSNAKGYGVEGEQLMLAAKNGLRVMEVPVSVKYNHLGVTSKKSALMHGADLMSTLFRLVVEERPLKYLGTPGIGLICMGAILGVYLLWTFNMTRCFSIPVALLTFGMSILGLLMVVSAVIFQGLKRIDEKLRQFNEK